MPTSIFSLRRTGVALLLMAAFTSTQADLRDGMQAYEKKNYDAAFKQIEPLAQLG